MITLKRVKDEIKTVYTGKYFMHHIIKSNTSHIMFIINFYRKEKKFHKYHEMILAGKKTSLKTCNNATYSDMHAWIGLHAHR